jgi:hypothetical protein
MKTFILMGLLVSITSFIYAQTDLDGLISAREAERIEKMLASDEMRGRRIFSPEIEKAADFIAAEFKSAGLQALNGDNFRQEFAVVSPRQASLGALIDGKEADPKNILVITSQPELKVDQSSGYEVRYIKAGGSLFEEAYNLSGEHKDLLIMVDEGFSANFPRLSFLKRTLFKTNRNKIFILGNSAPDRFNISATHEIKEQKLANVVGILPGKTKPDEYVIFSGHYDHIGVGKPVNGDSIYNGANDDAAGITAVILLAKYYAALNNN